MNVPPLQLLMLVGWVHPCDPRLCFGYISLGAVRTTSNLSYLLGPSSLSLLALCVFLSYTYNLQYQLVCHRPRHCEPRQCQNACNPRSSCCLSTDKTLTVLFHFPASEGELYSSAVGSTKVTTAEVTGTVTSQQGL